MSNAKRIAWTILLCTTVLAVFAFALYMLNTDAPWMQITLPIITLSVCWMLLVCKVLLQLYEGELSTEDVDNRGP